MATRTFLRGPRQPLISQLGRLQRIKRQHLIASAGSERGRLWTRSQEARDLITQMHQIERERREPDVSELRARKEFEGELTRASAHLTPDAEYFTSSWKLETSRCCLRGGSENGQIFGSPVTRALPRVRPANEKASSNGGKTHFGHLIYDQGTPFAATLGAGARHIIDLEEFCAGEMCPDPGDNCFGFGHGNCMPIRARFNAGLARSCSSFERSSFRMRHL